MTAHDATEQAYQNGYYKGKAEAEEHAAKEIAKLTEERDAAISAIERSCKYCKKGNSCDDYDCITDRVDNWEWIGVNHD